MPGVGHAPLYMIIVNPSKQSHKPDFPVWEYNTEIMYTVAQWELLLYIWLFY